MRFTVGCGQRTEEADAGLSITGVGSIARSNDPRYGDGRAGLRSEGKDPVVYMLMHYSKPF